MAGLAGEDPFDFEDASDGDEFCYDPFDCDGGGGGSEGEELVDGPFVLDVSDGEEFCVSGFAFPDGGDDEIIVVEDRERHSAHEEPIHETLGRSFDSDGGLSQFYPHLVSALDLVADTSEEEIARYDRGGGGFTVSGLELEQGLVIEEADDDDGLRLMLSVFNLDPRPVIGGFQTLVDADEAEEEAAGHDGLGLMLSGFNLDPRPVIGGFQTLVDADEAGEEFAAGDDGSEGRGFMLSGFDLGPPPVAGTFRMVVDAEDTDSDDANFDVLDVLAGRVGEATRRLPASRAAVEGLPEVKLSEEEASRGCAVCKDAIAVGESVVMLPCKHCFHGECIRPWLAIRNTCPVCRFELPMGNAEYDRRRSRTGVASVAQQGAPAQSGGVGAGATTGAEDATGCTA